MAQDPNQDPYSGYGQAPQNPYGTPPPPPGYNVPPGYGAPSNQYDAPGYGYGYGAPNQGYVPPPPLPLGEAIRQLPKQYLKVLTNPSANTFAEEMGKASWDIVWVQLIGIAVIVVLLGFLSGLLLTLSSTNQGVSSQVYPQLTAGLTGVVSLLYIIFVPIGFFIGVGILYLIAKAFKGQGTFLAQGYTSLLIQVPMGIVTGVVSLIPILGLLAAIPLSIYSVVLNIFSIMAVHRLSGGKATAVVFMPLIIGIALSVIVGIIILGIVASIHR